MAIPLDPAALKALEPTALPSEADIKAVLDRYEQTKQDRINSSAAGVAQFVNAKTVKSRSSKDFAADPYIALNRQAKGLNDSFPDKSCKSLVLGAGFGSLSMAARLVQAGLNPSDIRIVDPAGDFGGTWYWNRYPGAMCDTESYIYLPFLEETGHVPTHRYVYAPESVEHAGRIAKHFGFHDSACFYTSVKQLDWDDASKKWRVVLAQARPGQPAEELTIASQYVFLNSGTLSVPQLPKLPGLDTFKGNFFHTARFDYSITGGQPGAAPELSKLKDMRVAIVGTGASAIQCTPELAKWAKHLYVFQRTPSQVDWRGQARTDPAEFAKKVATGPGWQRARAENFTKQHSMNPDKPADLIADAYSAHSSWSAITGGTKGVTMENVVDFTHRVNATDMARANRVRARIGELVHDPATAESLKFWSTGFCKRPCFHDDYLPTFNRDNVTLIDTNGTGVEGLSENGILCAGKEYPVDLIVFSTGFRSPVVDGNAGKAGVQVTGRGGVDMETKSKNKWGTLHGVVSHDFPNMFFPGPSQAGVATNFTFALDRMAVHIAHMVAAAEKKNGGKEAVIEPTEQAEEEWTMRVLGHAAAFAPVGSCGPSYFNAYGEASRPMSEAQMHSMMRGMIWAPGLLDYEEIIDAWRKEGSLAGLSVS